eukprot:SAG25_NODE_14733_length_251_cov_1.026316_1_plen_34_part_01
MYQPALVYLATRATREITPEQARARRYTTCTHRF